MASDERWLLPDQDELRLQQHRRLFVTVSGFVLPALFIVLGIATGPMTSRQGPAGPPPADRELLWYGGASIQDPLALHLQAFDWTGVELGTLTLPCRGPCSFFPSPDGQRLLVFERTAVGEPTQTGRMYDARGRLIASVPNAPGSWADDSRHFCGLRSTDPDTPVPPMVSHAQLTIADLDHATERVVASITGVNSPTMPGFWGVLACSVVTDRAVVAFSARDAAHDVRVVQLSTGRTLYARDDLAAGSICGCPVWYVEVNPTGAVAVEDLAAGGMQRRDLVTGAIAAWPSGSTVPGPTHGISWSGRRIVVDAGVVDVSTGQLVWRASPSTSVGLLASRPGSDDMLLFVSQANGVKWSEVIVQGSGEAIQLGLRPEP